MTRLLVVLSVFAGALVSLSAQDSHFEAVVLKENSSGDTGQDVDQDGAQYRMRNVTMRTLILTGYRPPSLQLVGAPSWTESGRYDLVALLPAGASTENRAAMLRSLLRERAALSAHYEDRDESVYFLMLARADRRFGSAMRVSPRDCAAAEAATREGRPAPPMVRAENGAPPCGTRSTGGEFLAGGITMESLARNLSSRSGRIVIDRTGLDGYFELTLRYAEMGRDGSVVAPDLPSVFTALQEQLGLKLESGRAPVQTLIIDHIERPTVD